MSKLKDLARDALNSNGETAAAVIDEAIYGSLGELSGGKVVAKPISIDLIWPDAAQPRRAHIPSLVREGWDGRDVGALFNNWIELYANETHQSREQAETALLAVVNGHESGPMDENLPPANRKAGVMENSLMEVVRMALDLRQSGLNHAIEVFQAGEGYRIQFGERRWLAFHLLRLATGEERWAKIPAVVAKAGDVWRQASENTQRSDLNAIGRARQMAILLMAMYQEQGTVFEPYEAFDHDREFYAQVSDGNAYRIPRGQGERLLAAMGLKDAGQLRQYRALLTLPNSVWTLADDYNISENWLREARKATPSERLLYQLAVQEAARSGYVVAPAAVEERDRIPMDEPDTVTAVTVSPEGGVEEIDWDALPPPPVRKIPPPPDPLPQTMPGAGKRPGVKDVVEMRDGRQAVVVSLIGGSQAQVRDEDGRLRYAKVADLTPAPGRTVTQSKRPKALVTRAEQNTFASLLALTDEVYTYDDDERDYVRDQIKEARQVINRLEAAVDAGGEDGEMN